MLQWPSAQPNDPIGEGHVMVTGSQIHRSTFNRLAVLGLEDRESRVPSQKEREEAFHDRVSVQDDADDRRQRGRKLGQQLQERLNSPGRSAYRDDVPDDPLLINATVSHDGAAPVAGSLSASEGPPGGPAGPSVTGRSCSRSWRTTSMLASARVIRSVWGPPISSRPSCSASASKSFKSAINSAKAVTADHRNSSINASLAASTSAVA